MSTSSLHDSAAAEQSALLAASLAGDTDAFGELVVRHQNLVTGICYSMLGSREASEEAAQEAFVIY